MVKSPGRHMDRVPASFAGMRVPPLRGHKPASIHAAAISPVTPLDERPTQ